ncbi:TonB-dependent siderophore receptor [Aliiglaciecola sp. LCG003]|uniref:TonB-dependent siderophore receptor n=1 Tax=Aliiglaciecola sp. LCG003 TaxID=3053655 RepID=UPI002572DAD3|nr:TonB-dependent siderophore receptor [Aliiglaciecola sp. LCG003]WJG10701.1 TonB-dependent siderophore receptor [Aliiglaciecola sp. LCG003]
MNQHKLGFLCFSVLLGLNSANPAIAQSKSNEAEIEVVEVQGSYIKGYAAHDASGASHLDLSIADIPQSVSVITSAQMQDFQLTGINEALESATGVNVERIETDRTYYTARGFDITNFQVDGIGLPLTNGNNHANEDTAIYDRVEVIRGANGLMTGVGNPSATINFIRKRPTADTQLLINGTRGSWNNSRIEIDLSTPITDKVSGRFVAVKEFKDSYLDRYQTDKNVVYGFIEAKLSDDTTFSLSHTFLNTTSTGNSWGALPLFYTDGSATQFDASTNTSADWSNWHIINNNTVAEISHYFTSDWRLKATYTHKTTDEDTELFYVFGTPNKETGLGLTGYASEYDLDDKHDLFDIYVNGDFELFERDHQLVFGANYAKMSYQDISLYDYANGFPSIPDLDEWDGKTAQMNFADGKTGSDVTETQKAVYFTARFNLADELHLITGGRYNYWDVEGISYGIDEYADESQFIPYVGLVYKVLPNLSAYASYTETFVSQTERDINNNFLAPVTGESQEVGVKGELFDGKLIASFAYFDVLQKNLAVLDPATLDRPIDDQRYMGAQGISSDGFEIDIAGQLYPGLQVSMGYTDFTIDGNELVANYTPSQMLKLGASYKVAQVEGLSLGVNMRWQNDISRVQGVVAEGFTKAGQTIVTTQDAYSVVSLMARYEYNKHVSLTINANNVMDEKYLTSLYWAQGYYGAPANYSASLTIKM